MADLKELTAEELLKRFMEPFKDGGDFVLYEEILCRLERLEKCEAALRWALGEEGEFPPRPQGHGPNSYWWRTELRKRAALELQGGEPDETHTKGA